MSSEQQSTPSQGKKIAVSLESSFLGFFAHAGFMNSLLDSGFVPHKVAGSSAGALIASAYASGLKHEALKEFALNRKLQRSFREWKMLPRVPTVFAFYCGHGLTTGQRAVRYLRDTLPVQRIEDTPQAELSIGVTNVSQQKRELIQSGDLAEFTIASCAVPPVIRSQEIDGQHYLDGGFTDISPIEQWIDDDGVDTIILHRIITDPPRFKSWTHKRNTISCWSAVHGAATNDLQARSIEKVRQAGKDVIIHETITRPPSIIVSRQVAQDNYQAAYQGWQNAPTYQT